MGRPGQGTISAFCFRDQITLVGCDAESAPRRPALERIAGLAYKNEICRARRAPPLRIAVHTATSAPRRRHCSGFGPHGWSARPPKVLTNN